jgi:mannose-6-phosphate isomerase-like protein (cupin superfamily)
MPWRQTVVLLIALIAVAVAAVSANFRSSQRTILRGDTFEDDREQWFKFSETKNEDGEPVGLYEAMIRARAPGALPGRSSSPPLHSHKTQRECFSVREGQAVFLLDGKEIPVAGSNDTVARHICVPPRTPHSFWNALDDSDLRVDVTLQPPGNSEAFFRSLTGFGKDQGGFDKLSALQMIATFVAGGVVLEDIPKPVWWVLEHVLVPWFIVPVLGVEPLPQEYTAY